MPVDRDAIGSRGEGLVTIILTRFPGREAPLFRPQFMGDKYPSVDYFVELVGTTGDQTPFILAQVKTTQAGYTRRGHKLKVRVTRAEMSGLLRYPAPTYVIGVDEPNEVAFILAAVTGGPQQLRSMGTSYPLGNPATLQHLYDEVLEFWAGARVNFTNSRFT